MKTTAPTNPTPTAMDGSKGSNGSGGAAGSVVVLCVGDVLSAVVVVSVESETIIDFERKSFLEHVAMTVRLSPFEALMEKVSLRPKLNCCSGYVLLS